MTTLVVLQNGMLAGEWDRLRALLTTAGQMALNLLLAIVVFLIGWAIARLAGLVALYLFRAIRLNEAARGLMADSGRPLRFEPAALGSWVVHWSLLLLAVMAAVDVLGFSLATSVGQRLGDALPRAMAATIELVVGITAAMALGAVTQRMFETAGFKGGRLRGQVVTAGISAFAVLLALEQLGLAAQFIMALGITAIGAVGLTAALAFGLGCRELARDFVVEYLRSLDEGAGPRAG